LRGGDIKTKNGKNTIFWTDTWLEDNLSVYYPQCYMIYVKTGTSLCLNSCKKMGRSVSADGFRLFCLTNGWIWWTRCSRSNLKIVKKLSGSGLVMENSPQNQSMITFLVAELEGGSSTFGKPNCLTRLRFSLGLSRTRLFWQEITWSGRSGRGTQVVPSVLRLKQWITCFSNGRWLESRGGSWRSVLGRLTSLKILPNIECGWRNGFLVGR
jgi:hypothetical protein